jgi:hypothetical protein
MACQRRFGTWDHKILLTKCPSNNQGNRERHFGTRKWIFFVGPPGTLPLQLPREWAREIRTCNLSKDRGQCSRPYGCGGLRRITTDSCRFRIAARACDSPRQSTTTQTNQPASTGSEDRVVEHKGSVRRGVVFFRPGARAVSSLERGTKPCLCRTNVRRTKLREEQYRHCKKI